MPTVVCWSNGLICGYITGIHLNLKIKEKSSHMSREIFCYPSKFYKRNQAVYTYTDNLMVLYDSDFSQLIVTIVIVENIG